MDNTWTAFTMMIGQKAYKDIRPLSIEMIEEENLFWDGYLWWRKEWTEKTGRWYLKFTYDRGPMSGKQTDYTFFDKESIAKSWYTLVYNEVFLRHAEHTTPPEKPNKSNNPLRLL